MSVPVPAYLSYTGKLRWENKAIDSCIAPIVKALNDAGIYTSGCCCGHGKSDGNIILHDGRVLIIQAHLTQRAPDLGYARAEFDLFSTGSNPVISDDRKPAPSG